MEIIIISAILLISLGLVIKIIINTHLNPITGYETEDEDSSEDVENEWRAAILDFDIYYIDLEINQLEVIRKGMGVRKAKKIANRISKLKKFKEELIFERKELNVEHNISKDRVREFLYGP